MSFVNGVDNVSRVASIECMTNTTEQRIAKASKLLGKTTAKLAKDDPEMAKLVTDALAEAMERLRK